MTLNELYDKRDQLQWKIHDLIVEFEKENDIVIVTDIGLKRNYHIDGSSAPFFFVHCGLRYDENLLRKK